MPRAVRRHGRVIDPSGLEAGDLILISSKKPDWTARQIRSHQEIMFSDEHAKWQHVAISGGRFEICEASVTGVTASEYWKYMTGEYEIKVRRLRNADEATRNRLAYHAAKSVRRPYGFWTAYGIGRVLKGGDFWKKSIFKSSGVVCSQLFFEACMREGYLLANIPPENICPAHLSMSNLLSDIHPEWVSV